MTLNQLLLNSLLTVTVDDDSLRAEVLGEEAEGISKNETLHEY